LPPACFTPHDVARDTKIFIEIYVSQEAQQSALSCVLLCQSMHTRLSQDLKVISLCIKHFVKLPDYQELSFFPYLEPAG
jgi:hypothetical protein